MLITDKKELEKYYSCHRIWQGIPGIAVTREGRTFVSLYSGNVGENYGNFCMIIKSDNGKDFSEPVAVAEKIGRYRCFDSVLWIDPLERLWFIWNVMPGEEVVASICENPDADELVWSHEFVIGRGVMMNKPIVLSSGEWLFPISFWKFEFFEHMRKPGLLPDDKPASYVYKTSDNGKTFTKLGGSEVPDRYFDEHMVVEQENCVLKMLVRTTYGIGASYSYDRGKNWSKGEPTKLGGPCSRFFISRLKSGRILLINHYNFTGRNNLTAFLSEDDGNTFPYTMLLDERENVSYPDAFERDGFIHITYDRERGASKDSLSEVYESAREILTAKITEDDIINGRLLNGESYLKNIATKLGSLSENDTDPFLGITVSDREFARDLIENEENEKIVDAVFDKFPANCINLRSPNAEKLDSLIGAFYASEEKDIALLEKIIKAIRLAPSKAIEFSPAVQKIRRYVEDNITEDFSLKDIALYMNMSVYYLSHVFKAETGTTVIEYRNELRLTRAKQMLLMGDSSITDIALKTGFCTAAYFTEVFSASEKISPAAYRKLHKR